MMPHISVFLQQTQAWPLHPLFEILGYFLGYRYFLYLRRKQPDPISSENRIWILVGAAIGALVFSRVLALLETPNLLTASDWKILVLLSNKTIVGGLLGGLWGVEITKKILRVSTSSGDLITYPLMLGMMIGRVGCFFAGLADATYGSVTNLPWGVDYGDGVWRHPSNLYEILFLGVLWLTLVQVEERRTLANGARFKIFMISYLAFRFAVEFIKPSHLIFLDLSAIQLACLLGLIYYAREIFQPSRLLSPLAGDT